MLSKFWLHLTIFFCSVKHSALEEAGVSDCLDKEPHNQYMVYAGETVYFQCILPSYKLIKTEEKTIQWFLQKPDKSLEEVKSRKDLSVSEIKTALQISPLKRKHSGTYICRMRNLCMKIIVDVQEKENCPKYGANSLFFRTTDKGSVSCPSLNCQQGTVTSNVTWYKYANFSMVPPPGRDSIKISNNDMQLFTIYVEDSAIYTCDYVLNISGKEWIMRATIQISVDVQDTQELPLISGPSNGTEIEAELGKPIILTCKFLFGYERSFSPVINWTVLHPEFKMEHSGRREHCLNNTNGFKGYECSFTKTLDSVTKNDLRSIFHCSAQNSVGSVTTTFKLSRKEKEVVFRTYILWALLVLLLLMLIGAGTVFVYWVEIVLLYRHYLSKDETIGDNKDFDAFISYATQTLEFGEDIAENSYDNYEDEQFATQLLPGVLEDNYNYKLCILDRDILPGGAYVEDIAKIIRRSRRAIFILSQRYLTSQSLFELQAAITCSLEEQESLKLILIKLKPFKEPETIPHIVKKALRTLPTVSWKGNLNSKSAHNTKFWKRVRYYMPVKKNREHLQL